MDNIGKLLTRDFSRPIEEIIKVNNDVEDDLYTELTEYIATDRIKTEYRDLFKAISEAPSSATEAIGVWVSGFFGSGKSSFAKNLGLVLSNRTIKKKTASELFVKQLSDKRIGEYVELINARLPTEVVMFDVQVDLSVQTNAEQIAEVVYRVLLRQLGYAEDYQLAELEMDLESRDLLEKFQAEYKKETKEPWEIGRKKIAGRAAAARVLRKIDPENFPTDNSLLDWLKQLKPLINIGRIVERAFELCERRRKGKALIFIIDEVGQYVARSADKIESLRALVEQFGRVGKQWVRDRRIPGPAWVVVTSQEKLDDIVAALDTRRVELSKLQDRFKYRVDLHPADIREVATKRVLGKTAQGEARLRKLYRENEGTLNMSLGWERTARTSAVSEEDFVQFYPYPPHFIDLSIDIVSGIRLQPGAPRHVGGSNRTLISQAYEMIVNERTRMADAEVGKLVTLDRVYELVEGNLASEKQKDISDIEHQLGSDPQVGNIIVKVAKAICLLEFVRGLPRTPKNIAACLVESVGAQAPVSQVERSLERLKAEKFAKETEDGWKLQTAGEKRWDDERRRFTPKKSERNEILRNTIETIFKEPYLKSIDYKGLRKFESSLKLDDVAVTQKGDIPLCLYSLEADEDAEKRESSLKTDSMQPARRNEVLWLFQINQEIEDSVREYYASRQMVLRYRQIKSQGKINPADEGVYLQSEEQELTKNETKVTSQLETALSQGVGFFRGVRKDAGDIGGKREEIIPKYIRTTIPDLYPRLELGARPMTEKTVDEFLKQTNLANLPPLFHEGPDGLGFVRKENTKYVLNPNAEIAKEILDYLKNEHSYGNKVTGGSLAEKFSGIGYGWDRDVIRLVLAVLLRTGAIEVTYQGRRFRSYQEPQARTALTNNPAFRSAGFSPRESIDLKSLTTAVRNLEEMTGQEVDVEEGVIAEAFKKLADDERESVIQNLPVARMEQLPVVSALEEWLETLNTALAAASDDCVRMLAGEGNAIRDQRRRAQQIHAFLSKPDSLKRFRQARIAIRQLAPALSGRPEASQIQGECELAGSLIDSADVLDHFAELTAAAERIARIYQEVYTTVFHERAEVYGKAIDEVKGMPEFVELVPVKSDKEEQPLQKTLEDDVLGSLISRAQNELDLPLFSVTDARTGATLPQLESDIKAVMGFRAAAISRMRELLDKLWAKDTRIERVRVTSFLPVPSGDKESDKKSVEGALDRLKEHIFRLIDEGVRVIWE